ncbi:membrane protein [Kitasatospora phosalacinea]|uniref:Membrane protein n=1 Tax=Kitasatospora phosalacinea TaxID=2065 RepID=A0A9W6PJT3_9ACTN|nr:membrane protein [Kitasatospora phosalacinea]
MDADRKRPGDGGPGQRIQGELRELRQLRELRAREQRGRREERPSPSGGSRTRLDQPRTGRPGLVRLPAWDPEAFGKLSERIARFLGTGRFIVWMTVVIIAWVVWNTLLPESVRFDDYPFIFLTLMLSLQASYAAPLILLAQNRQDDRDRVNMEQDRARSDRNIADTEYLTREVAALRQGLGEVATRDFVRSELQSLLKELDERRESADTL